MPRIARHPHPTDQGNGTTRDEHTAEGGGRVFIDDWRKGTTAKRGGKTLWRAIEPGGARTRAQKQSRRLITTMFDRPIWCDRAGQIVVRLTESGLGCRLDARRGSSGKLIWSRFFRLPPPAPFSKRVRDTDSDEEIVAFLTDTPNALALGFQRSTPHVGLGAWRIEPDATLEVRGIDPRTGRVLWTSEHPGAHIGRIDRSLYEGLHANEDGAWSLDLKAGRPRLLLPWEARVAAQPRRMGRNVLLAWSHRTGTSIRVVEEQSAIVAASIEVPKPAKHGLNIMHAGGVAVVNIDTHRFVVVGPGPRFKASPILQIKGFFDGLTLEPGGVACIDARYWHVRVNAATGREISRTRVVPTPEQEEERKRALQGMTDQADR